MHAVLLQDAAAFAEWRGHARRLLLAGVAPEDVSWGLAGRGATASLFAEPPLPPAPSSAAPGEFRVPRALMLLLDRVLAYRDAQRHGLAYRLLWRHAQGERDLLLQLTDPDVLQARTWEKAVRRDLHKMKAFVRFREVRAEDGTAPVYVAWFEPSHDIVERIAPFFVRRFAGMHWSILTPGASAHWDGAALAVGPGAERGDAPADDALEALWRSYYSAIFNPARLKVRAMKSQMPMKYWKNLPEAQLIPELVRNAAPRAEAMLAALPTVPRKRIAPPAARAALPLAAGSLDEVRQQARGCRACPLWKPATQTVFGEGPADARIMVIGEQPGDLEDLAGRPFIGPAGQLFDRALAEAGLSRAALYVTNTVKHFKFEPRGKRRIHARANAAEQAACRPWLEAELSRVRPQRILCLGAMAATAVFGAGFRLLEERGQWRQLPAGGWALATLHPAYLLRLPSAAARDEAYALFAADLRSLAAVAAD